MSAHQVGATIDLASVELTHGSLQALGRGSLVQQLGLARWPGLLLPGGDGARIGVRHPFVGQEARAIGQVHR